MRNILVIVVIFCGIACSKAVDVQPRVFEDTILGLVNGIIANLTEPFELDVEIPLELDTSLINGTLDIKDVNIRGIKALEIPEVNLGLVGVKLNMTLLFRNLEIDVNYAIDSLLLTLLPIYGEGLASINLHGLAVSIYTSVNITSGIQLKDLRVQILLDSLEANIKGLLYDDDFSSFASSLISTLANNLIVPYLDQNADAISDTISEPIQDLINGFLAGNENVMSTYEKQIK